MSIVGDYNVRHYTMGNNVNKVRVEFWSKSSREWALKEVVPTLLSDEEYFGNLHLSLPLCIIIRKQSEEDLLKFMRKHGLTERKVIEEVTSQRW
jgi:hypothetical protein